jgi:Kef-type K+ transport system membrane component KefB
MSVLPLAAFAQGNAFDTANDSVTTLLAIVSNLSVVAFMAILLFFFWLTAKYIWGGAEDKEETKNLMIWSVVAVFIAASIWGLVQVLQVTFNVGNDTTGTIPRAY